MRDWEVLQFKMAVGSDFGPSAVFYWYVKNESKTCLLLHVTPALLPFPVVICLAGELCGT